MLNEDSQRSLTSKVSKTLLIATCVLLQGFHHDVHSQTSFHTSIFDSSGYVLAASVSVIRYSVGHVLLEAFIASGSYNPPFPFSPSV